MFHLFKKIPSITAVELQAKRQQDIVLLDVRTPAEYRHGHIAQAKNVPLNKINTYQHKGDRDIVVICQSGMRSKQAAKTLSAKGYTVYNVRGGMNQWTGKTRGGK